MPAGQPDWIGPIAFFSIKEHPSIPSRHFVLERFAGLNGISIWDTGESGKTFTVRAKRALPTYAAARQFYRTTKVTLENSGAWPVMLGGVAEPGVLYKVTEVRVVKICNSVAIEIGNENSLYFGWCELDIDLVPIRAPNPNP